MQVIQDMREGRKWKVQVALLSQSLQDFDSVMIEFATSIFIMEAGPEQSVAKTAQVFGLSATAQNALRTRVHGPRDGGATFLAQFATKDGMHTQLLTSTLGPIELWALNTTAEDVNIRNQLYKRIGPRQARRVLAKRFPMGTATKLLEEKYAEYKEATGLVDDDARQSIVTDLIEELCQ
jgi:intracellular multiplication protein IcmB